MSEQTTQSSAPTSASTQLQNRADGRAEDDLQNNDAANSYAPTNRAQTITMSATDIGNAYTSNTTMRTGRRADKQNYAYHLYAQQTQHELHAIDELSHNDSVLRTRAEHLQS